jgi:hypothetical protein
MIGTDVVVEICEVNTQVSMESSSYLRAKVLGMAVPAVVGQNRVRAKKDFVDEEHKFFAEGLIHPNPPAPKRPRRAADVVEGPRAPVLPDPLLLPVAPLPDPLIVSVGVDGSDTSDAEREESGDEHTPPPSPPYRPRVLPGDVTPPASGVLVPGDVTPPAPGVLVPGDVTPPAPGVLVPGDVTPPAAGVLGTPPRSPGPAPGGLSPPPLSPPLAASPAAGSKDSNSSSSSSSSTSSSSSSSDSSDSDSDDAGVEVIPPWIKGEIPSLGKIVLNESRGGLSMGAHCLGCKARVNRTLRGERPGKGRPMGFLLAWLLAGGEDCSDPVGHFALSRPPKKHDERICHAVRVDARLWGQSLPELDGLWLERDPLAGELEEPEQLPH